MDPEKIQQASSAPPQERLGDATVEQELGDLYDELDAADEVENDEEVGEAEAEAEVEEEAVETDGEPEETETVAEEEEVVEDPIEETIYDEAAPERWPEEMKEVYAKLPPEARKAMLEQVYKPMQRQYTQTTQELAQMRKAVEPMLEAMNHYRNDFERMGVNPAEVFRTQMAWAAHFARVGPQQGISDMSAAYGQQPTEQGQEAEEYLTPIERSLRTEIDGLKQAMQQTSVSQQQFTQQQQQQSQQVQYNRVQQGLQSFIGEQVDGKPAHPHVERVAPAIAGLIRGGLIRHTDEYGQAVPIQTQMTQAYKMACDLDPSIRSATGTNVRQVARVKAARDVGVVANNPAGQVDVQDGPIVDDIDSLYDKLNRRSA
jgi:hypothetical protein